MASSLGEKLRQAREAKGMELRDVADNTRITLEYLRSIEDDNYKSLPGGIFNKGFVRSFAKAVGIDEKEALADYNNLMAQQGTVTTIADDEPISRPSKVLLNENQDRSPFMRIFLSLIVLGLVGAGIYFGYQYWQNRFANAPVTVAPSPTPAINNSNNAAAASTPTTQIIADELKVQIKAMTEDVSLVATVDNGKKTSYLLKAEQTQDFSAQQSLKLVYSKYKANALQITINGKPVVSPAAPKPNAQAVEMEITKENFAQYVK